MPQSLVFMPNYSQFTGPLVAELLRFPNGIHDDQVDALAWLGLMMTEFATYEAPVQHIPSWRDKLPTMFNTKRDKSPMSA